MSLLYKDDLRALKIITRMMVAEFMQRTMLLLQYIVVLFVKILLHIIMPALSQNQAHLISMIAMYPIIKQM